jgi:hypothetical protein
MNTAVPAPGSVSAVFRVRAQLIPVAASIAMLVGTRRAACIAGATALGPRAAVKLPFRGIPAAVDVTYTWTRLSKPHDVSRGRTLSCTSSNAVR